MPVRAGQRILRHGTGARANLPDSSISTVASTDRFRYLDAMNGTLAQLHGLDYLSLGRGDYGKPGRYVARQLDRWSRQYMSDVAAGRNADVRARSV
jgi:aminoglycoside phosphotransferase (APT) family kinase protein